MSLDRVHIVYRACKVLYIQSRQVQYQHPVQIYVKYNMKETENYPAV
jgi:hypothetical protein